jgi:tetratricopeptide (TPR) repeat protein
MKRKTFFFLAGIVAVAVFLIFSLLLVYPDALARFVWSRYSLADMAMALNRHDAALAKEIGDYYFGGGAYDVAKAKQAYRTAISLDPAIGWAHYQLARLYFVESDFYNALKAINEELELYPDNQRSFYVRGLIRGYSGDLIKAEEDFRRFVAWAPREWAGYNDLAWILAKREKWDEMKSAMNSAFASVPDAENNPWLWNMLGVGQLNLKEYEAALGSFEKAKALAMRLSISDWRRAYPGNSPEQAAAGLKAFLAAIAKNIAAGREGLRVEN